MSLQISAPDIATRTTITPCRSGRNVLVVGAGILGASVAWHLARQGINVTVLEKEPEPARGVTRWSYGWVGTGSVLPSDDLDNFASKLVAIHEFERLERELGPLPIAAQGAIVWLDSDEETIRLIEDQQAAGAQMTPLQRTQIRDLEPCLASPPAVAAWAPNDFAIEPADLTRQLLAAAQDAGAKVIYGESAEGILTNGGRAVGVRTANITVSADTIVMANAASAISLVADLGITIPVRTEPAVLMRFEATSAKVDHLLYCEGLELRPDRAGGLVSAADYPLEGDAGLDQLAERTAQTITRILTPAAKPPLKTITAVHRPMMENGKPLRSFLPGIEGLYAIIAHPGVILAPHLGLLAATEIIDLT